MATVKITAFRTFTGGNLKGVTCEQSWTGDAALAPKVGDTHEVPKTCGGSPYHDRIIAVEPYTPRPRQMLDAMTLLGLGA